MIIEHQYYYHRFSQIAKQNVSREKYENTVKFISFLLKWQNKINLISKKEATFQQIWERHIEDSLFLADLISKIDNHRNHIILDIGSGNGFPAIILAIMLENKCVMIESDLRKSLYLSELTNYIGLSCEVINCRVEELEPNKYSNFSKIITSRALATIDKMLTLCSKIIDDKTIFLLPKGKTYKNELIHATTNRSFGWEVIMHNEMSYILRLDKIKGNDKI